MSRSIPPPTQASYMQPQGITPFHLLIEKI